MRYQTRNKLKWELVNKTTGKVIARFRGKQSAIQMMAEIKGNYFGDELVILEYEKTDKKIQKKTKKKFHRKSRSKKK